VVRVSDHEGLAVPAGRDESLPSRTNRTEASAHGVRIGSRPHSLQARPADWSGRPPRRRLRRPAGVVATTFGIPFAGLTSRWRHSLSGCPRQGARSKRPARTECLFSQPKRPLRRGAPLGPNTSDRSGWLAPSAHEASRRGEEEFPSR
jgi:hypothetical protein